MNFGSAGVSNRANTSSGYADNVSAANSGTLVGYGVSGVGIVDEYNGGEPSVGSYLLLEDDFYLIQEVGDSPNNRFELEA